MPINGWGVRLRVVSNSVDGHQARVWLNDAELSSSCAGIKLDIPSDGAITATITLYVSELNADVPALAKEADGA